MENDFSPKINLIYYKNIIENVLVSFFSDFNDDFRKIDENYVFSSSISRNNLKLKFIDYIVAELEKYIEEYNVLNPRYYLIIGACYPKDNILLSYLKQGEYFPDKLRKIIDSPHNTKYFLKERDIKIDNEMFNGIFEDIFNGFFDGSLISKYMKKYRKNVFFIKNRKIDCYMMLKVIKNIYGSINTINLHKENIESMKSTLYSVNEMIDKYVNNKKELVRSDDFTLINNETKQYIDSCLSCQM